MKKSARHARPRHWRRTLRLVLRTICWVAIVIGLALGLYLTLRPSSSFKDLWWLPASVEVWADHYGRFRNVPAFALLAVPCLIIANGRRARRKAFLALAAFVAVTELAQYFIPTRWCEWQDIVCGWAGLAITWFLFELSFVGAWRIRNILKARRTPATAIPPVLATARKQEVRP